VYSAGGNMVLDFTGPEPLVDSPEFSIAAPDRPTVVLRYRCGSEAPRKGGCDGTLQLTSPVPPTTSPPRYSGASTVGKFVVRGTLDPSSHPPGHTDFSSASWSGVAGQEFPEVFFPIVGDGHWRTTAARLQAKDEDGVLQRIFDGTILQLRMYVRAKRARRSASAKKRETARQKRGAAGGAGEGRTREKRAASRAGCFARGLEGGVSEANAA
jgi:hypothetical protein